MFLRLSPSLCRSLFLPHPRHPRPVFEDLAGEGDDGAVARHGQGGHDGQDGVPGADVLRPSRLWPSRNLPSYK